MVTNAGKASGIAATASEIDVRSMFKIFSPRNQPITNITDDVWSLSVNFTVRQIGVAGVASIVALGVFHTTKQSNGSQTGFAFNTVNNTTFDTTINNVLDVTAEFSSNSPLNSIMSDIFVLNKIY